MERNQTTNTTPIPLVWPLLITIIFLTACTKKIYIPPIAATGNELPTKPPSRWLDWNVMFSPGMNAAARLQEMNVLEQYINNYITQYNSTHGTFFSVSQSFVFCPCDSLLYNLYAIPTSGSGSVAIPPTNPHPRVPGSGDTVAFVNENIAMELDLLNPHDTAKIDTTSKVYFPPASVNSDKTLAIMDTGLDSTLFKDRFSGLMWNDPGGRTLRNFQFFSNGRDLDYYNDDDNHKHGTAVTVLALQAAVNRYQGQEILPKIMVLKVLDNNRLGSSFTVSCALSYAHKNNATMINASLGYYTDTASIDPFIKYYSDLCISAGIPILAAAGNLPGIHNPPLCADAGTGNRLTKIRRFYPACYSPITAVTGLHKIDSACFYQNYSSDYVAVGVHTPVIGGLCCQFNVGFLSSGYEGTSFATPIVSGLMMGYLLHNNVLPKDCLEPVSQLPVGATTWVTKDGRYIDYVPR